jgi:LysM repeat protein
MSKKFLFNGSLIAALLLAMVVAALPTVEAAPVTQSGNIIVNGGFESTGGSTGAASWSPWWAEIPKPTDGSFNYAYKPESFNVESVAAGAAASLVLAGDKSQRVINSWDPWYAGVKQTVAAPVGARVRLTAATRIWTSTQFWPAPSDTTVGAVTRVGIEPNGTDNQFANTMVWSGGATPHTGWQTLSVEAVVGSSGKVTAVLSGDYRGYSRVFMAAFWDEVTLVVLDTPTSAPGNTAVPGATTAPQPTQIAVQPTQFVLPTPGSDGNIIYVVQEGDTLWRIASIAGKTVDEIKSLNGLTSDIISVGQRLIIGQGAASVPPTNTPDPNAPTAAPTTDPALQPSATPAGAQPTEIANAPTEVGQICALMYVDVNGNGFRDGAEALLAGGQLAVVDTATGQPVQVHVTDGVSEPHCFANLAVGEYSVSAAAPNGYNPTTEASKALRVDAGTTSSMEFGAQASGTTDPSSPSDGRRLQTALLGAAGVVFLLLAAGVAGFFFLRRR